MVAAMFGQLTTVQLLLDNAADVRTRSLQKHTALALARQLGRRETRDLLEAKTDHADDCALQPHLFPNLCP